MLLNSFFYSVTSCMFCLHLWQQLQTFQLQDDAVDRICWRWTSSLQYIARSSYEMFYCSATKFEGAKIMWRSWAAPRVKLFMYLALHRRTWTAERRRRHGLQATDDCALCDQAPEHIDHLLVHCPFAREVWWSILSPVQMPTRYQQGDKYNRQAP